MKPVVLSLAGMPVRTAFIQLPMPRISVVHASKCLTATGSSPVSTNVELAPLRKARTARPIDRKIDQRGSSEMTRSPV